MFAARYGFLKDAEVPFGRLQPYVAVGPGILFTNLRPKIGLNSFTFTSPPGGEVITAPGQGISSGSNSDATICLEAETGLRWMALKNVSIEASFKYRYAQPSFTYSYMDSLGSGIVRNFHLNPTYNFFSGQVGVAYHF